MFSVFCSSPRSTSFPRRPVLFFALLLIASTLYFPDHVFADDVTVADAQPTGDQLLLPLITSGLPNVDSATTEIMAAGKGHRPSSAARKIIVDVDPGVDDAAALIWLLSQRKYPIELLGIVTVAGNTDVNNATNNVLTLLDVLAQPDIPVVRGAAAPLKRKLSRTGAFVHGPDGLWFLGRQNSHDLSMVPHDAVAFYCATAEANPGATLLALGPLTNVAQALDACPDAMQQLDEVIILGGAKVGGNATPVSEFNFWIDPEAAKKVMNAGFPKDMMPGLPLTIVPLETFSSVAFGVEDFAELAQQGNAAAQFLSPALQLFADVAVQNGGTPNLPDVVATMYALDHALGETRSALTKIITKSRLARGQSIIGFELADRIPMIANDRELSRLADRAFTDPTFDFQAELLAILTRQPDNTQVVTRVNGRKIRRLFTRALTR